MLKGWGWDERDRLNVNGSGISLGHPIGSTGGRILANLLRELQRRDGKYGLETMCIGGGAGHRRDLREGVTALALDLETREQLIDTVRRFVAERLRPLEAKVAGG